MLSESWNVSSKSPRPRRAFGRAAEPSNGSPNLGAPCRRFRRSLRVFGEPPDSSVRLRILLRGSAFLR